MWATCSKSSHGGRQSIFHFQQFETLAGGLTWKNSLLQQSSVCDVNQWAWQCGPSIRSSESAAPKTLLESLNQCIILLKNRHLNWRCGSVGSVLVYHAGSSGFNHQHHTSQAWRHRAVSSTGARSQEMNRKSGVILPYIVNLRQALNMRHCFKKKKEKEKIK